MVYLLLRIRVAKERQVEFRDFLKKAIPYYEEPGGIKVRLLQADGDEESFIELIEYDNEEIFQEDNWKVDNDPDAKKVIAEWRSLLMEPPVVEVWRTAE